MSNYYGFETTEDVKLDAQGLPIGTYKAYANKEEEYKKDNVTQGFTVEWEVLEGDHKGKKGKVWYLTQHLNSTTANIAQQSIKRIAEASGTPVTQASPIQGRTVTLVVGEQKKNPQYTEIKKYLPADYTAAPF
jgi:ribosomal protein L24